VNKTAAAWCALTHLNNWVFETVPQTGLDGRKGYQPRGKVLAGSSAINATVHVRGHRSDYDHWASLGNEGWSYEAPILSPWTRLIATLSVDQRECCKLNHASVPGEVNRCSPFDDLHTASEHHAREEVRQNGFGQLPRHGLRIDRIEEPHAVA
jgi:choline dehydrogenase-like flavoprotein